MLCPPCWLLREDLHSEPLGVGRGAEPCRFRPTQRLAPIPGGGGRLRMCRPTRGLPQLDQSETPCCDSHATGLIFCPPFCQISKCRCEPVDWPRLPIVAICCPAFTCCPELTSASLMWPYTETLPSSCWIRTHLPNPLAGPASITFPEVVA